MKPTRRMCYIWQGRNCRYTIGSALIALIAAILIFSVLAAALLPLVSSSGEQAVLSSLGDKAYLLSEAGLRYVQSRYNAEADKNAALEALDDGNFTLDEGQGEFRLAIYSYFFPIPDSARGTSSFTTNPPGRLPIDRDQDDDNVTIQGLLNIDGHIYTITSTANADENVVITVNGNLDFDPGANAYPAATTNQTSIANGGDLFYTSGEGGMFPLRNGRITVGPYKHTLTYAYNDRQNSRFLDVRDPEDPNMNASWSSSMSYILLDHTARVRSTGIIGGGSMETSRKVNYYIRGPAPELIIEGGNFQATDADTTTAALNSIDDNEALAITASVNNASLLQLSSVVTEAPLRRARRRSGGYLSYDAQVKLGFYSGASSLSDDPIGIIPESVSPVAAGLTFRLNNATSDTAYSGYGLSFMRADGTSLPSDYFSNIVPAGMNDQPLMVLWQQTGAGTAREWIAYKRLEQNLYQENFDLGIGGWSLVTEAPLRPNLWQRLTEGGRITESYPSGSPSLNFGDPDGVSFFEQGGIISPAIQLCDDTPKILLLFWSRDSNSTSRREVRVIADDGSYVSQDVAQSSDWTLNTVDITSLSGREIQIRFYRSNNTGAYSGWFVDEVQILCQWPVQNSTLLVRLREAAVVEFSHGGPQEILQGDWVYGETSGTRGRVLQPPLLTDTGWNANTAAGTLLLNRLSVNASGFQSGENLLVVGRTGGITAQVDAFDNDTERKVNIIKTYYARASGSDAGNTDPLDPVAHTYPRRGENDPFRWPPYEDDNWTAEEDYFRLVQWDAINDDNVTGLEEITFIDDDNRTVENAVIRSYDTDLQSPPLGLPISTELGLHAYGAGADNVYFDDFGLRLFFGTSSLFDTVLQQ